jgi:parallel beta-helix repeat protein
MRKLLLSFVMFAIFAIANAQTFVFQEDFEGTTLGVTSTSVKNNNNWAITTTLAASGLKADSAKVGLSDTTYLTTDAFSTLGSAIVYLEFDQIAKMEFFDAAIIEVSTNNGATWTKVTSGYLGAGQFVNIGSQFNSTSYATEWVAANNNAIPNSSWWKHEKFDLSSYLANTAQAKIRFTLMDLNGTGSAGNYGWLLDNIQVWKPSAQEASVAGYFMPFALASGCGLGNETLQIDIANNGSASISGNLTASFKREGQAAITENVNLTITPYDTVTYTFTNKIDLYTTLDTNYKFKVWVSLLNDPNQNNDTLVDTVSSRVPLSPPLINDTTIPFNTGVTLHAVHQDSLTWYSDPLAQNQLTLGSYFTTPILIDTTTYYVQAGGGGGLLPDLMYYKFDAAGTSVPNSASSPVGVNPTPITGALTIGGTGLSGMALNGTGIASTSNVINTGWSTNLSNGFTIAFWTSNVPASSTLFYIWGDAGAATFRCFTNGVASANNWLVRGGGLPDLPINGAATMAPNMIHVVYDKTAGTYKSYINGVLSATVAVPSPITVSGTGFQLGGYSSNSGLSGKMDEFRMYSYPLTAAEVLQSATAPVGGGVAGACPSIAKPVKVMLSNMPLYNSGVTSIVSPAGGYTQGSIVPVVVNLKNFSGDTLQKVNISYSINGVLKNTVAWTGNLLYNQTTQVTLGTDTFAGGAYGYKAWTWLPNDSADQYTLNDTASSMAYVCLAGTFTLGDASSDFPDFATLQTILGNVGICGPTVIKIKSGTYNQQFDIQSILGLSAVNTLTFESFTGNAADVKIQFSSTGTADNFVIKLNGVSYVTFKNLTLNAKGASYATVVEIVGGSHYNVFDGCHLKSDVTTSSTGRVFYFNQTPTANNYNIVKDCKIEGGYYGIYHYGSSAIMHKGTQFLNNDIFGFYYYGLYSYYSDSLQIIGNYVHDGQNTTHYHIYNYYGMNGYRVVGNKVIGSTSAATTYGIQDYYTNYYSVNPAPAQFGLVANNMISLGATGTNYGLYAYYSNGTKYVNNTINLHAGSATNYGVYQYNTASNTYGQYFKNNIYSNTSAGSTSYCVYFGTPASVMYSDYNDYYTTNTNLAYYSAVVTTLAALQSASGKDANSKSVNPNFFSNIDLHSTAVGLNASASPDTLVTTDFDGDLRHLTTPDIGADEFILLPNDAGIISLVSPIVSCPGDTSNVIVALRNFGTAPITSASINWSINNITQTPFAFTGNIAASATANVLLGTYVFNANTSYNLAFWSTNPNSVVDSATYNDSLEISGYKTAIPAGTYTIGSASSADYPSLTAAVSDLNAFGICGPVVFNVDPGTYNSNIALSNILGSSAVNTITFKSTNGDSSSVIVNWTPTTTTEGGVSLKNQSYVTIQGITFNVVNSTSYGRGVYLEGNSSYNNIKNCVFNVPITTSSNMAGIYASSVNIKYNVFDNNIFNGGYYGAYIYGGSSTSLGKGNRIDNNIISNIYYYGIYAYYQDSIMIRGNTITNSAASLYPRGIYSYYCDGPIQYTGNKIIFNPTTYGYGMYIYYNDATSANPGLIANNFISVQMGASTSTSYGMYVGTCTYQNFYHNSINLQTGYASNRGIYFTGGTNLNLKNNIIKSDGYAYYVGTTTAIVATDYNDLFTTGTILAYWGADRTNLAALKTASTMEAHSISIDPNYFAPTDLHLVTSGVDGMGTPIATVSTDIDGDLRSTTTPDMGADEFNPPAQDISVFNISAPINGCGMTYENVIVQARNTGFDTIHGNLVLKYSLDGGVNVVSETITAIIPPTDTITHTFTTQANLTSATNVTYNLKVWGALPQDPLAFNDTATVAVFNGVVPASPTLTSVSSVYATTATLAATASGIIFWYDSLNATLPLGTGTSFTTPVLFDTTVYYCGALGTNGCISVRVPDTVYVTGIPAGDFGISSITVNEGCGLDSSESVTIEIYNQGYQTITSGATARFRVDNNAWTSPESITTAIPSNGSISFTFAAKANLYALIADTLFDIQAAVTLTGDPYHVNDTLLIDSVLSRLTPKNPIVTSPLSIGYGASAALVASSTDTILWFAQYSDSLQIGGGSPFNTPALYEDTTFWAQAGNMLGGAGGNIAPLSVPNASTCNTGSCATLTDLDYGTCGTQQMWISTSTPPDLTPGVNYIDFVWPTAKAIDNMTIHHAQDNARFLTGATLQKWDGSNWVTFHTFSNLTMQCINNVPFPLVITERLRITSFQMTGIGQLSNPNFREIEIFEAAMNGCVSDRIPVIVDVASPPAKDAGMYSIENPVISTQSGIPVPVTVKLKNYGTDTLTSTTITYKIDNQIKANYSWTGSVPFGDTSNAIIVYTDTFTGGYHSLEFYVTGMNGTTQAVNLNDTIRSNFTACMNGTYTIGNSTKDFQSFNDAITMLATAGICGNVTFLVDSGTYTEQLAITAIPGVDAYNTVTFRSANGDSTSVILQYAASATGDNFVVKLSGADYFRFENMTIQAMGASYAYAIVYENGADFNKFEGCIIKVPAGTSSYYVPVYSASGVDKFNEFIGNRVQNGYYSFYIRGTSTTVKEIGTTIVGNIIENFYYYGVYSYYLDSLIFSNNLVKDGNNSYIYPRGLYAYYGGGAFEYVGNVIKFNPSSYGYGIYLGYHASTSTAQGLVANNMISINGGTGTSYGIYGAYVDYTRFFNNSVNMIGGLATSSALYLSSGTFNEVLNNALNIDGTGYPYYVSTASIVTGSDYNVYHTTGTNLAYWGGAKTTLAALQSANSQDLHSKVANPNFFALDDLHTSSVDLNGAGYPLSQVTVDIDGQARHATTPDIGADEFTPPQWDAGAVAITSPTSPLTVGSNPVKITLRNFGLDTLVTASVGWKANGVLQSPYSFVGNLPTGDTIMNLQIGSFTAVAGANTIKAWTSMPNGHNDQLNINDTTEITLVGCTGPLAGVYTIGGATADFPDFSSAVQGLNYCGVNDTVIFLVNSGTYNEQIKINPVLGASPTSYIEFRGVTGDSTDVLLTYAQSSALNYVVYLNGADYINFKHMTIEGTGTAGYAVLYEGGANYNSFSNCVIKVPYSTSSTVAALRSPGSNDNYNRFVYNDISGGYYAIQVQGVSTSSYDKGTLFSYNKIHDFYYYGAYIQYQDSLIFDHNYVNEGASTVGYYPTYFYYCNNYYEISNNTFDLSPSSYSYGLRVYYCTANSMTPGKVFNNSVTISTGTGANYGLYVYYSNYVDVMFNSINVSSGSNTSRAAYLYYGGNIRYMNNNTVCPIGYTYYTTSSYVTQADRNNLYATPSSINAYWGTAYTTLSALQAASMMDANSVAVDPGYYSTTDLHATNPILSSSGTPFGGVTHDYDGDLRSITSPSIGMDEFSSVQYDGAAYNILQPVINYAAVTTTKTVEATFRNFGNDTITSMTLGYKYANSNAVTQVWNGQLLPGGTLNFTFTTPFTVQAGSQSLCVFNSFALDQDNSNDTFCMSFTGMPLLTLTYTDNFDGPTNYWAQEGNVWQRGTPGQTTLNAAYTAPNAWMTKLTSNYPDNSTSYLYSPFFDISSVNNAMLKFVHKYKIPSGDGGSVQYSTDGGQTWILLGFWGDPLGTNWYTGQTSGNHYFGGTQSSWLMSSYNLSAVLASTNNPIQFRFVLTANASGNDEGWLIDNFSIELPTIQYDGGVVSIPSPGTSSVIGMPVTVSGKVKNFGSDTLFSIPMSYTVNGGAAVTGTFVPSNGLKPGDTATYTFTTTFTSPSSNYNLCVRTQVAGDGYTTNDQLCKNVTVTAAPVDAGVSIIVSPIGTAPLYTPNTVVVRIKNYGTSPLSTVDVQYKINSQTPVVETWSGTALQLGDSVDYTFSTQYNSPIGSSYLLCSKTLLTGDMDNSNDESCGTVIPDGIVEELANGMKLWQNIPNPARSTTMIQYEIPTGGQVNFEIVDLLGNVIMSTQEKQIGGIHSIEIDASKLSNGVYFYSIEHDGYRMTKQMVVNQ